MLYHYFKIEKGKKRTLYCKTRFNCSKMWLTELAMAFGRNKQLMGFFSLPPPSLFSPIFARETACQNCCIFSLLLTRSFFTFLRLENRTLNLNIVWSQIWFRASAAVRRQKTSWVSPAASPSKHTFPWHKTFLKPRASSSFYVRVTTFIQISCQLSCWPYVKYAAVSEMYKSPYTFSFHSSLHN